MATDEVTAGQDRLALFKEYLAEPRFRIKLDDTVNTNLREALRETADDRFPPNGRIESGEDVAARLKAYEEAIRPLQENAVLLGRWATAEQLPTLSKLMTRMADGCAELKSGTTIWLNMRWYPLCLLAYSAGVAALSAENYAAFAGAHLARIDAQTRRRGETTLPVVVPVTDAMVEMASAWKAMAGQENLRAPQSEYIFKILGPVLDELLFLGGSFEQIFDRYEILRALMYADLTDGGWGPVGRFGWKHYGRGSDGSPYMALRAEAEHQREQWGPIRAGLFRGSYTRFEEVAKKFEAELLSKLNWY